MKYEQLTEQTQDLLSMAQFETALLKHKEIDCMHLLLAIIVRVQNPASRIVHSFGVNSVEAREAVKAAYPTEYPTNTVYVFTENAKQAVNQAIEIARVNGFLKAQTEHLLEAVLQQADAGVAVILDAFGLHVELLLTDIRFNRSVS